MIGSLTLAFATGSVLSLLFLAALAGAGLYQVLTNLVYICGPNEVLVFSGGLGAKGYKVIKGGRKVRIPFLEDVDRLDLTNMNIEVSIRNAFSRGGIPLNIDGIANVKITGESPGLDNALERLLGKPKPIIMRIAKETLEGYLRGVLATLSPEEVNSDTQRFEKELRKQASSGFAQLGLTLDNLKIQAINDDQGYLTAMGRVQSAELQRSNRIAEAERRAESLIKQADARQRGELSKIEADRKIAFAECERRIQNADTASEAWVAEQKGEVQALLTRAKAELALQDARIAQMKHELNANIVKPAQADMEAAIAQARGDASPILERGRAQASALRDLAGQWKASGTAAKDIFLLQKLEAILPTFLSSISKVRVDNVTMLQGMGGEGGGGGGGGSFPLKAVSTVKALEAGGVDVSGLLARLSGAEPKAKRRAGVGLSAPPPPPAKAKKQSKPKQKAKPKAKAPVDPFPPVPAPPASPMGINIVKRASSGRRIGRK